MNKKSIMVISSGAAIIVIAYFLMSFLSSLKKDPPKVTPPELVRFVNAKPVEYSNLSTSLKAGGRLNSKSEIVISAEVSGKILEGNLPFKKGQNFKKGDLLIRIFDVEASLALKSKKSLFLNRVAVLLPDFKISFTENYDKWFNFFEKVDIEKDIPELPKITSTKEKVFLSNRNILSDYFSIKSDEERLKKYKIFAPFDGSISTANLEVGAIANPGNVLGKIINTEDMELEVPVEIEDAKWLKIGDVVQIHNGENTTSWEGKISRKSSDVDINTQSINIYIGLKSSKSKPLYKGQYLNAYFKSIKLDNVMRIDRSAIFNNNEAFIVQDSLLVKTIVNVKKISENDLFFNGLKEGTNIVTEPLVNARENIKVKIIKQ